MLPGDYHKGAKYQFSMLLGVGPQEHKLTIEYVLEDIPVYLQTSLADQDSRVGILGVAALLL